MKAEEDGAKGVAALWTPFANPPRPRSAAPSSQFGCELLKHALPWEAHSSLELNGALKHVLKLPIPPSPPLHGRNGESGKNSVKWLLLAMKTPWAEGVQTEIDGTRACVP